MSAAHNQHGLRIELGNGQVTVRGNEISKAHGRDGLPPDTLKLLFTGAAGQSFGCFATKGLHMEVTGNANDYFGKGLSGARLVAKVPETATFKPEENVIIGNVALYGATAGDFVW